MDLEIRLFVIDDSAVMRQMITKIVEKDKHIRIVGRARNGREAVDRIVKLKPDVVTLDVEMPLMDGLETLKKIMEIYPVPVVMLSAVTGKGAHTTLKALELGAVDFILKPANQEELEQLAFELPAKIKLAATVPVAAKHFTAGVQHLSLETFPQLAIRPGGIRLVVIGTSTGGPSALQKVVPKLPKDIPAGVLIVQHMPEGFTRALAERLNQSSHIFVKEAQEGDLIKPGLALVAPAGRQMYVEKGLGGAHITLRSEANVSTVFKPSVDVTMLSAAEVYGNSVLGVIMTGMGSDGVRGLKEIKRRGGSCLAEAEQTCTVFGMPKAAINAGVIDEIHPVDSIAAAIIRAVGK
ncbi:MAG TPA: chemotaxis response regulator protein-glutamate methylesterase [Clostridia bacterium]|jgi:two-component system chemotaxis response regulator CheB|nr:chemotaxis response regulator protein-glutamate methylesterase [Clostridia bacterium]